MGAAFTLKGSGDWGGNTGKWRVLVRDVGNQSEAFDLAAVEAPIFYLDVPRGQSSIEELGGDVYLVTFDYTIRTEGTAPPPPATSPTSPPEKASEKAGTDISFTFGGKQVRVYVSKETKYGIGRRGNQPTGATAPNFNNLIGYNPVDHSVEGTEVYARSCEFTITKQYADLNYGYLAQLFLNVATTNKNPFRGMDKHSVLYTGSDGSFKGGSGEKLPWQIAGKFQFSPNQKDELKVGGPGGIVFPPGTVEGHDYIWYIMEETTEDVGEGKFLVARPKFGYVERVYDESDFADLGMET